MEQVITFEDRNADTYRLAVTGSDSCQGCTFENDDAACNEADNTCLIVHGIWVKD